MIQKRSVIHFNTLFGPISLESPYLWKKHEGATPLCESMHITHHGRSEAVNRALSDFGSEESFGQAAKRFAEHYHYALHPSTVSRVTKQIADEAFAYVERRFTDAVELGPQTAASGENVEQLLVELDGCDIRTAVFVPRDQAHTTTPAAQTPQKQKQVHWREVRIGLARPLDAGSSLYVGKKASYPDVIDDLVQAAVLQGMSSATQVIGVADGGIGLKEELERQFPGMHFILDKPHLKNHLYETAEALGLCPEERSAWVHLRLEAISQGNVTVVRTQLQEEDALHPHERRQRLIGYLERFSEAVDYKTFQAQGYPIGSGEIESAHRAIPQKRLKLPGACWHPDSINPMLALRILRANEWWDDFWQDHTQQQLAA